MKLKYEMTFMDMDGSPMAVPMTGDDGVMKVMHMNDISMDILKVLENDVTEDEIAAALKKEYDATDEQIRKGVQKVLNMLRENDLLNE